MLDRLIDEGVTVDPKRESYDFYIDHVLGHFEAQRVMLGSNWPVAELDGTPLTD